MRSFFDSNSCDNRERRSTRAEERDECWHIWNPGLSEWWPGGLPGDSDYKDRRGLGFCGGRGNGSSHEGTATVLEVDSERVMGAKNLQILNTGKIIRSPYSLQTSLWKQWLLALQGASVFVKEEEVKLLSVCPQHWMLSVCFPLCVKLHCSCFGSRKAHLKTWAQSICEAAKDCVRVA